jgi:hypothetical protein
MIKCLYIIRSKRCFYIGITKNINNSFKKIFSSKYKKYDIGYEPLYVYDRLYNLSNKECYLIINSYIWTYGTNIVLLPSINLDKLIM